MTTIMDCYPHALLSRVVASLTNDICISNKEKICGIGKD